MADWKKVIKGLDCCESGFLCSKCPYDKMGWDWTDCVRPLAHDALVLLKAQEAIEPYMDYDGRYVWRCGLCGASLFHLSNSQADEDEKNCVKYCRYCGKAVDWDGV